MSGTLPVRRRSPATLAKYTPVVVEQLQQIETDLGGRQQIVGMLALAPLTPDLRQVLLLLGDPDKKHCSLAEVCALSNVLPGDLMRQLTNAALLRGKVAAAQHIGAGIGAVAQDIMQRAQPHEDACTVCQGTGTLVANPATADPNPNPVPCQTCRGTGRLRYPADPDAQKLAVEMAQLLPKGGGLNIMQINQQDGGTGGSGQGALDRVLELSDRVLYGAPGMPAVEAEVLGGEEETNPPAGAATDAGDALDP